MTEMDFSCALPPGPSFAELAALSEQLGYDRVWIYDSAPLWEDPFVHLALAAERTERIGLATAVLVPTERHVMAMASSIATISRLSDGRLRAAFGTGFTARKVLGQPPMKLQELFDYVTTVRSLLAGKTVTVDGQHVRMMHAPGLTATRPIDVPIWVSVFGPRGQELATTAADGVIGPPHPGLPTATLVSGTVLEPDEEPASTRVREAVGPWRVVGTHSAYASGDIATADATRGGRQWREDLERLAPPHERHLLAFEGHVTHLLDRDRHLLDGIDVKWMVGDSQRIGRQVARLTEAGFRELIYTPTGQDVVRELTAFAAAVIA